jgi:hypothetical protein
VLFYQLLLDQFGKYGRLILNPPLSLKQCSELMHVQDMTPLFVKHQAILDYFAISTNSDGLVSLPMLIPNYVPTATKLPVFVYRLVTTVK